jgi:hypothetical protein
MVIGAWDREAGHAVARVERRGCWYVGDRMGAGSASQKVSPGRSGHAHR